MLPELTTRELRGYAIVELRGEFDVNSALALERCLEEVLVGPAPLIILDLSKALFADVAIMRTVLNAERRASARGRRLVLSGPHSSVARLLEITGFAQQLSVFPTVDQAAARRALGRQSG